jgi:hypothetical protein
MIAATTPVFPNNVVDLVAFRMQFLDADLQIFKRPLRDSDPIQCVGVFAQQWLPDTDSQEMRGRIPGQTIGYKEPSIEQYLISIQAFVKDMDEERGLATHSVLSEMVRTMLYRDATLGVALAALSTTLNNVQKRTGRWGIRQQRYFSNELQGSFLYLSNLEFWLETENT